MHAYFPVERSSLAVHDFTRNLQAYLHKWSFPTMHIFLDECILLTFMVQECDIKLSLVHNMTLAPVSRRASYFEQVQQRQRASPAHVDAGIETSSLPASPA